MIPTSFNFQFQRPLVGSQGRRPTQATDLVRTSPHLLLQHLELSNKQSSNTAESPAAECSLHKPFCPCHISVHALARTELWHVPRASPGSAWGLTSWLCTDRRLLLPVRNTACYARSFTGNPAAWRTNNRQPTAWRIFMRRRQHQPSCYAGQLHCILCWDKLCLPRDARGSPVTYRAQPSAGTCPSGTCHCRHPCCGRKCEAASHSTPSAVHVCPCRTESARD